MSDAPKWLSRFFGERSRPAQFQASLNSPKIDKLPSDLTEQINQRFSLLSVALTHTPYANSLTKIREYITLYQQHAVAQLLRKRAVDTGSPYVFELVASGSAAHLEALAIKTIFPDAIIRASDLDPTRTKVSSTTWTERSDTIKNSQFAQQFPSVRSDVTFITADARNLTPLSSKKADVVSIRNIGPVGSSIDLPNILFTTADRLTTRGSILLATALNTEEIPLIGECLTMNKAFDILNHGRLQGTELSSLYIWIGKRVDYPVVRRPIS